MNRGELWTAAGGVYSSEPRPVLIVQDRLFAAAGSVTVAPLTTHVVDAPSIRILVPPGEVSGLEKESYVMVDRLTTVRRRNIHTRIGRLGATQLVEVERAMMVFLGLAR